MTRVDRIFNESPNAAAFSRGYLTYLSEILTKMDEHAIAKFIDTIEAARVRGSRLFFIGNGGSAATASHFANDVSIGSRAFDKPFKAVSLCDNQAILTAIGNDFGFDEIFVRQLKIHLSKQDVVVAISASGNSPNIIKAVEFANSAGAQTIGLTGFDGGKLRQLAQISVHVPSEKSEYGPVEDVHMILDHLLGAYLMLRIRHNS